MFSRKRKSISGGFKQPGYRRRSHKRRRWGGRLWGGPRQNIYRRGANAKATRALMLIRRFKREEEKKQIQLYDATMQIPIAGNWIVEGFGPYCAQGQSHEHRIGNKTTVVSLSMRWLIKLTAIEAVGTSIRLVIVFDRRPNGANTDSATVFETDNQINSGYQIYGVAKGRFQIVMDKTLSFSAVSTQRAGKLYIQPNFKHDYSLDNAGTVADLSKGNWLIMAMAEGNAAAINVDYGFRFRFTDN